MSWEDFRSPAAKTETKEATFKSTNSSHFYAIFRIGKKHKEMLCIRNFEKHMERNMDVKNADKNIKNEILIGNGNVTKNVKEYIKDIKLRKNAVIARELLMTASPDFFKGLMPGELDHWKNDNVKFLKDNFGENCLYATLHKDEKTWHIHALIVPKFINKKGQPILSNTRYFDGIDRFREWQDNYAKSMQQHFKCLNRGIKYSKMKHVTLKHFYSLINQKVDEKDIQQMAAKAKNSDLLEIKIKAIQKTLEVYKNYNSKNSLDKDNAINESKLLYKDIEKMKEDKEIYKEALSLISQNYKIPQYVIDNVIKQCENINDNERER